MDKIEDIIKYYDVYIKSLQNSLKAEKKTKIDRYTQSKANDIELLHLIVSYIVSIAWQSLTEDKTRLKLDNSKVRVYLQDDYISGVKLPDLKEQLRKYSSEYYYLVGMDMHFYIDNVFALAVKLKPYATNADLKPILTDFFILKKQYPNLSCHLVQLENNFGGDYGLQRDICYGANATHTLMSFFDNVDLHITTLLYGDWQDLYRRALKKLEPATLYKAISTFKKELIPYV